MKISARLGVSENSSQRTFDLEDLNVTQQAWEQMSESEKHDIIEKAVLELPEQPYWMLDSFSERK